MKVKVLIVEDESIVALDIKNALTKLGHKVVNISTNYEEALRDVKKYRPQIILMDINLNDTKDGIDATIEIQKKYNIPIIYLTAYSDESTMNRAIKTSPLSYLLKPFKREELKTTILLGIYKMHQSNKILIETKCTPIGENFYYDLAHQSLFYKTIPIKLSVNERKLLSILVEAKGTIVSFEDLENLIWPDTNISESSLRTLIYRLRIKLEYKLIHTIPTVGCKLKA